MEILELKKYNVWNKNSLGGLYSRMKITEKKVSELNINQLKLFNLKSENKD